LLSKLHEAFPEHAETDLIAVRGVFDFARSGPVLTPREMKLFVNSLVAVYRQRGEEISLPAMAIYILHREKIVGTAISDDLIPISERRFIEEPDWRVPIAALHFGVTLDEATQLLLREPILAALRDGSKDKLGELEGRPGFLDVLPKAIAVELESSSAGNGAVLAKMAGTIGALEGASKPELTVVWRDIRRDLGAASNWDGLDGLSAEGIDAALTHTSGTDKGALREALATSLSKAAIPDPEGDFQSPDAAAENWLRAAIVVAEGVEAGQAPTISLPGASKLKIELLQQLAESDAPERADRRFQGTPPSAHRR
jgi:hypothetical protein